MNVQLINLSLFSHSKFNIMPLEFFKFSHLIYYYYTGWSCMSCMKCSASLVLNRIPNFFIYSSILGFLYLSWPLCPWWSWLKNWDSFNRQVTILSCISGLWFFYSIPILVWFHWFSYYFSISRFTVLNHIYTSFQSICILFQQ